MVQKFASEIPKSGVHSAHQRILILKKLYKSRKEHDIRFRVYVIEQAFIKMAWHLRWIVLD